MSILHLYLYVGEIHDFSVVGRYNHGTSLLFSHDKHEPDQFLLDFVPQLELG